MLKSQGHACLYMAKHPPKIEKEKGEGETPGLEMMLAESAKD